MNEHLEQVVVGRKARPPALPPLAAVSVELLKPLHFGDRLLAPGAVVTVDGYDAPTMIARGVARAI